MTELRCRSAICYCGAGASPDRLADTQIIRVGQAMQFFSYLSDAQVAQVHDASLEILEETGLLVRNEKARRRFAEHGCTVDHDSEMVQLPAAVVEKFRVMVPPTITLRGRDPQFDLAVIGRDDDASIFCREDVAESGE